MSTMDTPRYEYSSRPIGTTTDVAVTESMTTGRKSVVSWSAIAAGVVITMIVHVAFNLLGLSIGATTINPLTEPNAVEPALGTAALLWILGTGMLALFLGGWMAGHLAKVYHHTDGMIHGLVVWAVSSIALFLILASGAGSLISTLGGAVGQGVSLLAGGAVAAVPEVADSLNLQNLTLESITQESRGTTPATTADAGTASDDATTNGTAGAGNQTTQSLEDLQFNQQLLAFFNGDQSDQTQRQELVTLIAERAGIPEDQASAQLDRWTTAFTTVRDNAEQTAREVGEQLTNTLSAIAGGLFLAMLLGAFAGGVGGWIGTRYDKDEVGVPHTTTTTTRSTT